MTSVVAPARRYFLTLLFVWLLLGAAAAAYAQRFEIPTSLALPLASALLLELSLYILNGFPDLLEAIQGRLGKIPFAALLAASALLSYLMFALPAGRLDGQAFARLVLIVLVAAFWFARPSGGAAHDLLFLVLLGALMLGRVIPDIYRPPSRQVPVDALGRLMLFRLSITALMVQRGMRDSGFGFWPRWAEWKTGVLHALLFLPAAVPLGLWSGLMRWDPARISALKIVGTFAAFLWIAGLWEEFVFRGVLLEWLQQWMRRPAVALVATSILFGLCHLPFRQFPNWKFAALAAAAGLVYGRAYQVSGSVRASAVAHAIVVTLWRGVFS